MSGASATGKFNLLAESLPCAMDADSGVVLGDSAGVGKVAQRTLIDVDELKSVAVLGLEGVYYGPNTLADLLFGSGIEFEPGFQVAHFTGEIFGGAVVDGAATIVIDDGIAKNPVEPRDDGFLVVDGVRLGDGAGEGGLDDVFGVGRRGDTLLHERDELLPMGKKLLENRFG